MTLLEILQKYTISLKSYLQTALAAKQDTLTFDTAPKQNSTNPVTSDGVYKEMTSLSTYIGQFASEFGSFDMVPKSGSSNLIRSGAIYAALQKKQDTLTFDSAPKSGSSNPVTSDGIYKVIAATKPTIDTTVTADSNNAVSAAAVKAYVDSTIAAIQNADNKPY